MRVARAGPLSSWSLSPEQAVERALACEAAAFAADKRVTKADGTTLNTHQAAGYTVTATVSSVVTPAPGTASAA